MLGRVFCASLAAACLVSSGPAVAQVIPTRFVATKLNWNQARTTTYDPGDWHYASSGSSTSPNGMSGTASVGGHVEFGAVKGFAAGSGPGYYGLAESGWRDYITVDAGALNGSFGTITFAINFDWTVDLSPDGPARAMGQVRVDLNAQALAGHTASTQCFSGSGCTASSTLTTANDGGARATVDGTASTTGASGVLYAEMPVLFGQTSIVQVSLLTEASYVLGSAPSSAAIHADKTLTWGGTVVVEDRFGNSVPFTVTSASGLGPVNTNCKAERLVQQLAHGDHSSAVRAD